MISFLIYLPFLLLFVLMAVYAERKISAFIQSRLGPVETGPIGLFQTAADLLKMLQKEDIIPKAADRFLFKAGPIVVFVAVFLGFSVLPVSALYQGAAIETGLFFLVAIISLDVVGILMAGWGSNNKFSLYGLMRSLAQIISYEVPMALVALCVVMTFQTMDLQVISRLQGVYTEQPVYLFGLKSLGIEVTNIGGILSWGIIQNPWLLIGFPLFFIVSLAESNRAPFDLPESESEIIGGFHTEYSGFRWGIFMLAEYGMMLLLSLLASVIFLGSWYSPLPNVGMVRLADWTNGPLLGIFWLFGKSIFLVFVQMWVRWTFPRLRVDQLMALSWKFLTPAALVLVLLTGIWRLLMI